MLLAEVVRENARTASVLGIRFSTVLQANITKLRIRYPSVGFTESDSKIRMDVAP